MKYKEVLTTRGFHLFNTCPRSCAGTLKEQFSSSVHKGFEITCYPEKNAVEIKYHSITKWSGKLSDLESNINETIVQAQAA